MSRRAKPRTRTSAAKRPAAKPASGSRAELDALIEKAGLADHVDAIRALAAPAIRLSFRIVKSAPKQLGTTRAGGEPDLAVGSAMPGGPEGMSFLLQVRLQDLRRHAAAKVLPPSGLLSFFIDDTDLDTGAVVFTPPDAKLERVPFSDGGFEANAPAEIEFTETVSLPPDNWKVVQKLKLGGATYHDDVYNVHGYESWPRRAGWICSYHQLLGHHRNDYHDAPAKKDVGLLVLTSNDDLEWEFGDGNRLGFYIPKHQLENRRFDKAFSFYIDAC